MKRLWLILFLTFIISNVTAQQTVAVLDFEAIGVSVDEAKALSNRFGSEFLDLSDESEIELTDFSDGSDNYPQMQV